LRITSSDPQVRGWGVAGQAGGLFWVQDFAMAGEPIQEVRQQDALRTGVQVEIEGLAGGDYTVTPYDPYQGVYLPSSEVSCLDGMPCVVVLPDFKADMAFKLVHK
jgi:hypothetical protein